MQTSLGSEGRLHLFCEIAVVENFVSSDISEKKKTYLFHEIFAQKDLFDVVVGQDDAMLLL
jgi:hypothetical protein